MSEHGVVGDRDPHGWISVDERFPVNSEEEMLGKKYMEFDVIAFDGSEVIACSFSCGFCGQFWAQFGNSYKITHWMPLPNPPAKKGAK